MYLDKEKHVFPNQALDLAQKASSEYLGHPLACPTSMARDKDNKDAIPEWEDPFTRNPG